MAFLNSLYFSSTRCTLRVMLLSERENAISETEISYFLLRKPIMTTIYGERVGGMARGSSWLRGGMIYLSFLSSDTLLSGAPLAA